MVTISDRVILEVIKNERRYVLECSNQSPLGELYDSLCEMLAEVVKRIQQTEPKKADCAQGETCPTQES